MTFPTTSVSLCDQIDKKTLECLNEDNAYPVLNAFQSVNPSFYLKSSIDPQLLVQFEFLQPMRIERVIIGAAKDDHSENYLVDSCPASVKIFINSQYLGFSEAESSTPTHEATLPMAEIESKGSASVSVSPAKFRSVKSMALFFDDNQGGVELSQIGFIDIIGKPVETTNISEWKPVDKDKQWATDDP